MTQKQNQNITNQNNSKPKSKNSGTSNNEKPANNNPEEKIIDDENQVTELMGKIANLETKLTDKKQQNLKNKIKEKNEIETIFARKGGLGESLVSEIKSITNDFLKKFCVAKISLDNKAKLHNHTPQQMENCQQNYTITHL